MAVLQRIRNHSVALLIIVGFAMAAFIIGDLLTSSSSIMQSSRDKVVTINGKKITYEEFETARQRKSEFLKAMNGRELDNNASQQLTQNVYSEFVAKTLLDETCGKLGLVVPTEEINELVQGSHLSPVLTNYFGQYAQQIAMQFADLIVNDRFDQTQGSFFTYDNWMEIENQIKSERLMSKYENLVKAAVQPNKLEALDSFNGDNEECSFAYVRVNAFKVADEDVKVSADAVKNYYNATKRSYKLNAPTRAISYIGVQLRPSQADFEAAKAEIEAVREEFATAEDITDLVNGNSLVPYSDVFLRNDGFTGDLKTFVETGNTTDVLEPILQEGTIYMMARIMDKTVAPDSMNITLAALSTQAEADSIKKIMATDPAKAIEGLEKNQSVVGWFKEDECTQQFGKELAEKVFNVDKTGLFESELNSYYVVGKVTEKTAPVAKSKVAVYAIEVTPSSTTRRDEFGKLNQFLTENKTIKQMQDSAASAGFFMTPTTIASTAYSVGRITDARQAVRFAFQNNKGDVSEIFECDDNLLVVAITGDINEGYNNLNDTTFFKRVSSSYPLPQAKIEKLVSDINASADKTLAGIAAAYDVKVDTASFVNFNLTSVSGLGMEPAVIAAATKASAGEMVGPIAGRNSAVVLQVLNKNNKSLEYNEEARLQTVSRSRDYMYVGNNAISALQNAAEIEDNRINFY